MTAPSLLFKSFTTASNRLGVAPGAMLEDLPIAAMPLVLAHLSASTGLPVLSSLIADEDALFVRDALAALYDNAKVAFYPGQVSSGSFPAGFSSPLEIYRLASLESLSGDEPPPFLLFTHDILSEGLPSVKALQRAVLTVQPGVTTYDCLRSWLPDNGFESAPLVTEPGSFALRGSVIDCYPVNRPAPLRFDFDGDNLVDVREFDIHSQVSTLGFDTVNLLSLAIDRTENVSVFDHFPEGWVLIHHDDEGAISLTSHTVSQPTVTVNLHIEPFSGRNITTELFRARWDLLLSHNPDSLACFICERHSQFQRAASMLSGIPVQHDRGRYPSGFTSAPLGLMVLTPSEIFNRPQSILRPSHKGIASRSTLHQHLDFLEPGDHVVHLNYGIGRYLGLTNLNVGRSIQECLTIEYDRGDRVYVSTDKISLVFPYTFKDGQTVQLDSLQARRWERVKRRTIRSAEEIVDQLAELYAQRVSATGFAHVSDDEFQAEFEESFPYDDTPDQLRATEEIKRDMELPSPMDRLLCGDVGFGKTELALRAAFKAIRGGCQVALLAPTTILADQHYISFRARLDPFAVNVQMLSRFISPVKQQRILKCISSGEVDLLVGTHRVLSNDVAFKRLGLLIIDEEQRFGVKQKERIKEFKINVDVLSLSATPIPRTLHFSLAGIREVSRLDTPPLERIPIITSVNYYRRELISQAILKELSREGQVYFVHSEVKTIDHVADELRELLPNVTIAVAHGQMNARDLETTMLAFSEKRFQLLVCTSIIESGIDLPNVNTVIINNAHRFGLAQLYQIRGRVGRSNRQAYALLLIPRRPEPSREALKRLKTIERHTSLGSGYAIALKDLELRGAGNIFGLEQSGHVAAVGLDLYTRIIQGIVRERNLLPDNGISSPLFHDDVTIRIFHQAGIPDHYIPDPHLRLNLYRRLSFIDDQEGLKRFRSELIDRFGAFPQEVEYFLRTVYFRIKAKHLGVRSVKLSDKGLLQINFRLSDNPTFLIHKLRAVMEPLGFDYRFINLKDDDLRLSISVDSNKADYLLDYFLSGLELKMIE